MYGSAALFQELSFLAVRVTARDFFNVHPFLPGSTALLSINSPTKSKLKNLLPIGMAFALAWWLVVDAAVLAGKLDDEPVYFQYFVPGMIGTLGMFM